MSSNSSLLSATLSFSNPLRSNSVLLLFKSKWKIIPKLNDPTNRSFSYFFSSLSELRNLIALGPIVFFHVNSGLLYFSFTPKVYKILSACKLITSNEIVKTRLDRSPYALYYIPSTVKARLHKIYLITITGTIFCIPKVSSYRIKINSKTVSNSIRKVPTVAISYTCSFGLTAMVVTLFCFDRCSSLKNTHHSEH
jgi:hypothetical protein